MHSAIAKGPGASHGDLRVTARPTEALPDLSLEDLLAPLPRFNGVSILCIDDELKACSRL